MRPSGKTLKGHVRDGGPETVVMLVVIKARMVHAGIGLVCPSQI